MPEPQEILVRGPNWTGDLIMATPGFRALRLGFSEARLTLHLRADLLPLVSGAPWFDEVLPLAQQIHTRVDRLHELAHVSHVGANVGEMVLIENGVAA